MANHLLSNEQKLDAIYQILQDQEARHRRKKWFHIFKWSFFAFIIYFIATNPALILDKVTAALRPFIVENVKNMMDYEKNDLFQEMKKVLKENQKSIE